jgi:hypothetical protein
MFFAFFWNLGNDSKGEMSPRSFRASRVDRDIGSEFDGLGAECVYWRCVLVPEAGEP